MWKSNKLTEKEKKKKRTRVKIDYKWESEKIQTNTFWFLSPTTLRIFLNAKHKFCVEIIVNLSYTSNVVHLQIFSHFKVNTKPVFNE